VRMCCIGEVPVFYLGLMGHRAPRRSWGPESLIFLLPSSPQSDWPAARQQLPCITETNRLHSALFDMQNRTFCPYSAAIHEILISVMVHAWQAGPPPPPPQPHSLSI
jgi:hypothetical protein